MKININKDFSHTPGSRLKKEGDFSAEEFRETLLFPKISAAIENNEKLEVNLDGTYGICASFLDEAFGGLVLKHNLKPETIMDTFVVVKNEEGKEPVRQNTIPYSSYASAHAARKAFEKQYNSSKITFEVRQLGGNLNARPR